MQVAPHINSACVYLFVCLTGLSIEFATGVFTVWLNLRDITNVGAGLKKAGLETKLMVWLRNSVVDIGI